jgi:hypothetical protein
VTVFYPSLTDGYITASDNPIHLYKTYFLIDHLIPEQKWINGWCLLDYAGYDIFLAYPPLIYFLIAIVHYITGFSIILSHKLIFIFTYFLAGAGAYYFLRNKASFLIAFLGSIIFMLCPILYSIQVCGMIAFIFSVALSLFFFRLIEIFHNDMSMYNLLKASLLLSLIMPAHIFSLIASFIFLFSSFFIKLLSGGKKKEILVKYALLSIIPFLINIYYFYSLITNKIVFSAFDMIGKPPQHPTYSSSALIWEILNCSFIWNSNVTFSVNIYNNIVFFLFFLIDLLAFAGLVYYFKYERKKDSTSFGLVMIVFSLIIMFIHSICYLPEKFQILFLTQEYLTARLMVFFLLVVLYFAAKFFNNIKTGHLRKVFYILLIILTCFEFSKRVSVAERTLSLFDKIPVSEQVKDLWTWLGENIDRNEGRIVYQDTYFTGSPDMPFFFSHIMILSAVNTGLPQLVCTHSIESPCANSRQLFMEKNCIFGLPVNKLSDMQIYKLMKLFNGHYIVSCEDNLRNKLSISNLFLLKSSFPPFTVFEVKNKNSITLFEFNHIGTKYDILSWKDNHMVLNIENPAENNTMLLKITWHPYWKAFINNKEAAVSRNQIGFMEINLPEKGNLKVELKYNSFNIVTFFIGLAALLCSTGGFIYFYCRRVKEKFH